MYRFFNRLGLSLLLTLGVIAWNQQQTLSFSQSPSYRSLFFAVAQTPPDAPSEAQHLMEAVKGVRISAVRAVLDQGIDPDTGDIYSSFALSDAAGAGDLQTMRLLLDRGATVNITADEGYTPLMEATSNQQIAAAQLLLEHNADPNRVAAGQTPLAVAVSLNNVELAKLLLAGGADVRQASQGQRVLQIAEAGENPAMIDLIQMAEAVPE